MQHDQPDISASLADYLKTIHRLSRDGVSVHASDIARELKVSKPSVTGALRLLAARGMIDYAPYSPISLTPKGVSVAAEILSRFSVLRNFFVQVLQIPEEEAETAACEAEHIMSKRVFSRLTAFIEYIQKCPRQNLQWSDESGFKCSSEHGVNCSSCVISVSELKE